MTAICVPPWATVFVYETLDRFLGPGSLLLSGRFHRTSRSRGWVGSHVVRPRKRRSSVHLRRIARQIQDLWYHYGRVFILTAWLTNGHQRRSRGDLSSRKP